MADIKCFMCQNYFNYNFLQKHFMNDHRMIFHKSNCVFDFFCMQENCSQMFSSFRSFRRHLKTFHLNASIALQNDSNVIDSVIQDIQIEDIEDHSSLHTDSEQLKSFVNSSLLQLRTNTSMTDSNFEFTLKSVSEIMLQVIDYVNECNEIDDLSNKIFNIKTIFTNMSLYKHKKMLNNDINVNNAVEIYLGTRSEIILENGVEIIKEVNENYQYVSIIKTIMELLRNKNYSQLLINIEQSVSENSFISYTDGYYYKNHEFFKEQPNALALDLYYDDIEVCNPIGSKSGVHKISMFYCTILNFPWEINTKVQNIFLLAICYYIDLKKYGFKKILEPFITEIKKLENGIEIVSSNEISKTIYGTLFDVSGDSLAVNDILGFLSPATTHFCRNCMISRNQINEVPHGNFEMRTKEQHYLQLAKINLKENLPKDFGLESDSCLNGLKYFHSSENLIYDPMHDLLEGVVPMEIKWVLNYYVIQKAYITVELLNEKINSFKYGPPERKNKPCPNFTKDMLKSNSNSIRQKAIQSWVLLRSLPFIIIDLIPENDREHFILLYLLMKILEISFCRNVSEQMLIEYDELVVMHQTQFKLLFPQINLINKHHYIIHYSYIIRQKGPISHFNCLRKEAKHFGIKKQIANSGNYINVPKSIVNRQCVIQSNGIKNGFYSKLDIQIFSNKSKDVASCESSFHIITLFPATENITQIFKVRINDMVYTKNTIFVSTSNRSIFPSFYKIIEMIKIQSSFYFYGLKLDIISFESQLNAFKVKESENQFIFLDVKNLQHFKTLSIWKKGNSNDNFLSLKEHLF